MCEIQGPPVFLTCVLDVVIVMVFGAQLD